MSMADGYRLCTFRLDGVLFGVEVEHVREVLRGQETTRVPLAPPEVEGLINLRGQIVAAIDVRRRLGMPPRPPETPQFNIVVQVDDVPVSLLVDDVGDVLEVEAAAFERSPETVVGPARELIRGAYKLPGRLLLALDVEKMVRPAP
jgi:purine-binding chemotaxis protein CheW